MHAPVQHPCLLPALHRHLGYNSEPRAPSLPSELTVPQVGWHLTHEVGLYSMPGTVLEAFMALLILERYLSNI